MFPEIDDLEKLVRELKAKKSKREAIHSLNAYHMNLLKHRGMNRYRVIKTQQVIRALRELF